MDKICFHHKKNRMAFKPCGLTEHNVKYQLIARRYTSLKRVCFPNPHFSYLKVSHFFSKFSLLFLYFLDFLQVLQLYRFLKIFSISQTF